MERGRFARLWDMAEGVEIELTSAELGAYLDGWKRVWKTRLAAAGFRLSGLALQHSDSGMQARQR